MTDLLCESVPFGKPEALVHHGMLVATKQLLRVAAPHLDRVRHQQPDYRLVVTGHSLGAACALLLTIMLLEDSGIVVIL